MFVRLPRKIFLFLTAICTAFSVSCGKKNDKKTEPAESFPEMSVTFFDVGKADSMLIKTENHAVMIDCGEKGDGKEILQYFEENGIEKLDYLIITHYDKDHVGGAAKIIKNTEVLNVLAPDYVEDSDEVKKYNKALEEKNIAPEILVENCSFTLDDVDFTVYPPEKSFYGNGDDNDFSLVTKVSHHENILLFTGDAMEQRLSEIMDIGDCDFLKIPYHGRKLENLGQFLDSVKPESAVVCTSDSEFSDSTKNLLIQRNIDYRATCTDGQIKILSDGVKLSFE